MITLIVLAFAFGALVCYASCSAAANADRKTEEYFRLREMENYHGRHFKDE